MALVVERQVCTYSVEMASSQVGRVPVSEDGKFFLNQERVVKAVEANNQIVFVKSD